MPIGPLLLPRARVQPTQGNRLSCRDQEGCSVGDLGSIPGLERSPGEGKGHPLQYSGLENSMDCIVHGVTKSGTRLSYYTWLPVCLVTHQYASPSQGPWDPDPLRPALSLGGQATAWEGSPGRSLCLQSSRKQVTRCGSSSLFSLQFSTGKKPYSAEPLSKPLERIRPSPAWVPLPGVPSSP